MSEIISQRELRNDSEAIMRGLDEGRSYVITRDGVPVGELRPFRRQRFVAPESLQSCSVEHLVWTQLHSAVTSMS